MITMVKINRMMMLVVVIVEDDDSDDYDISDFWNDDELDVCD